MNAFLLALALVAPGQQEFDKDTFVKKFDESMSLIVATRLLLDNCYEYGEKAILAVSSGKHPLINEFGRGLPLRKAEAIKAGRKDVFEETDELTRIHSASLEDVKNLVVGSGYSRQLLTLSDHLESIRSYVKDSDVEKVVEVRFPTRPGELHSWFFFFRLTDDKRWRLEFVCPQIVFHSAPASAGDFSMCPR